MDKVFESRIPPWQEVSKNCEGNVNCFRCKPKDGNWHGYFVLEGRTIFGDYVCVFSCIQHLDGAGAEYLRELEKAERPKAEILLRYYLPGMLKELIENGRIKFHG